MPLGIRGGLISVRGRETASWRIILRDLLELLGIRGGLIGVIGAEAGFCRFDLRVSLALLGIRGSQIGVRGGGAIAVGIRLGIELLLPCGGAVLFCSRLAGFGCTG